MEGAEACTCTMQRCLTQTPDSGREAIPRPSPQIPLSSFSHLSQHRLAVPVIWRNMSRFEIEFAGDVFTQAISLLRKGEDLVPHGECSRHKQIPSRSRRTLAWPLLGGAYRRGATETCVGSCRVHIWTVPGTWTTQGSPGQGTYHTDGFGGADAETGSTYSQKKAGCSPSRPGACPGCWWKDQHRRHCHNPGLISPGPCPIFSRVTWGTWNAKFHP